MQFPISAVRTINTAVSPFAKNWQHHDMNALCKMLDDVVNDTDTKAFLLGGPNAIRKNDAQTIVANLCLAAAVSDEIIRRYDSVGYDSLDPND